jgi:hypothetical protein
MDQLGTTWALTTLSPILPARTRELTSRLRVVRYVPGMGRPLIQLAFIHYARWLILDGLPPARGGGGWRGLRWQYLLFESNFDGIQEDYLQAFADIVPARLAKLWGTCYGFDAATGANRRDGEDTLAPFGFRRFVERNQLPILDRYAAYPWSTATDVRQAIVLHDLLAEASGESEDAERLPQWLAEAASAALGPVSPSVSVKQQFRAIFNPWKNALRGQYGVNPISIITPLDADRAEMVRVAREGGTLLAGLDQSETHFARLVIVPPSLTDLGQPDPDVLETSYLLYTSDAWGTTYDHIEAIRTGLGLTADLIWGGCDGYPGHDDSRARFHAWVDSHTLPTRYYVAGYAPHSVSAIKRRLDERDRVVDLYAAGEPPPVTALLAELDPDLD